MQSTKPYACHGPVSAGFTILLLTALALSAGRGLAAPPEPGGFKEYQVKAAFLFNFALFVEWPEAAFSSADAPISIGVLGADPFGTALDQAVEGETVRNRPLVVKRSRKVDDLKTCHVVFVCKSERPQLDQILAGLSASGILTVGDIPDFARRGGCVGFYLDGNKVRFEINASAARKKNLKLCPQLLSLGKIVGPASDKENP